MIQYLYLGRVGYDEGLRLQAEMVELRRQGRVDNTLLLLEHPPVLTLGRNANRGNVLASDEMLAARGVTLHEINRGGDVTYHGPGQLVGYPIFDLRKRTRFGGRSGDAGGQRKVRTPQSSVPDNVREALFKRRRRKVPQKTYRLARSPQGAPDSLRRWVGPAASRSIPASLEVIGRGKGEKVR